MIKISTFTHKLKLVTPTRLNKKELLDEAKNISDFKDILESVEQIENCYSNYYRAERGTSMMRKVFPFVRTNLEIVEALINEKRSSLIDSTKGSPKQGKELEHEYWMLLHARVTSMYQNLNYNLEFPNMHDYLSITNR